MALQTLTNHNLQLNRYNVYFNLSCYLQDFEEEAVIFIEKTRISC